MSHRIRFVRRRIGHVSIYEHHGSWWVYHRHQGKPIRRHVGESAAMAECEASLTNARLVAEAAGVPLKSMPSMAELGRHCVQAAIPSPSVSATAASSSMTVSNLRQAFLAHHEKVLHSSLATVSRYRAATAYLEAFAEKERTVDPAQVIVPRFIEFLRTTEISPNGHPNTAKRRLRDKGVIFVLECSRSVYHFGFRHGFIAKHTANPFTEMRIGALRVRDAKPIFVFDAEQELAFFQACNPWEFSIHFTIAKTGVRPGELSHALIEDTDLERGWLFVRGKAELGWSTKTSRERRVPLIPEVVSVVRQVISNRTAGPLFLQRRFRPDQLAISCSNRAELATLAKRRLGSAALKRGKLFHATRKRVSWRQSGATPVLFPLTGFAPRSFTLPTLPTCPPPAPKAGGIRSPPSCRKPTWICSCARRLLVIGPWQ